MVDQLYRVFALFERFCQTPTDVPAAHKHYAFDRVVEPAKLAHHGAQVFSRGNKKYFVIRLDHGGTSRDNRPIPAINRGHTGINFGKMLAQVF